MRALSQVDSCLDITKQALAAVNNITSRLGAKTHLQVQMQGTSSGGGFVLGCRLVRAADTTAVKAQMQPAGSLAEAVARVQQQVGCWASVRVSSLHGCSCCVSCRLHAGAGSGQRVLANGMSKLVVVCQTASSGCSCQLTIRAW